LTATVVDEDDSDVNGRVVERTYLSPAHPPGEFTSPSKDPFAKDVSEIKRLGGLSATTKRRMTNQINKFHRGAEGVESKKVETNEISGYNAFQVVLPPYNLDYLAKVYVMSAPHYSAVNAKVSNIVGLGYTLVETTKTKRAIEDLEGNSDKLAKFNKKLNRAKEDLMQRIDDWHEEDTFTETLIKVWRDYEATGNGYLEIGRTNRGDIGYVGHIPATTVRIRKERDGFVQIISNKAVFFRNFGDTKTSDPIGGDGSPNEIIHIKKYNPTNGFYGVPDIVAAIDAIAGNKFAATYNLDYFENKAVPRHLITLKNSTLSTSAIQNLMEFFEVGLKGKNHRSLFIPLPADNDKEKVEFKIEPIETNVQDSSFNNYRKTNFEDILQVHRVPPTKTGTPGNLSLAAARDLDKTFKEQVCNPEQKIFEKKVNRILKELTDIFQFKLNELTLTDEDTQSKIYERAVRNGWILVNEARAEQGRPPVKGGDKMGGAMATIAEEANKQKEKAAQQQAEVRAQTAQSRTRDADRSANASDSNSEARNEQGAGRQQA